MQVTTTARRAGHELGSLRILLRSRAFKPMGPVKLGKVMRALRRWKFSAAFGIEVMALEYGAAPAIVDERGALTFGELDRRSNALADSLAAEGIGAGDRVAVMCRNHRGFVDAMLALAKLGADTLLMNTSFAGPQFAEVVAREGAAAVIYDQEFEDAVGGADRCYVAWYDAGVVGRSHGGETRPSHPTLDALIARGDPAQREGAARTGATVILTSGTTGTPSGVNRDPADMPRSLDPIASVVERIPLRPRLTSYLAAPMFHSWGLAHLLLGLQFGTTQVMRRRFDPEQALADMAEHGCQIFAVVPVMMSRILALPEEVRARHPLPELSIVAAGGSALPGELATDWMNAYGDNLYNTYGSTECAIVSIATPADMRAVPDTAGRPIRGTTVKLLGEDGREVPAGRPGRIFVASPLLFHGYTNGKTKETVQLAEGVLMSTGDMATFDAEGRLTVRGRDDEMIVSGGENVFPQEVERLLMRHAAVAEAAAIGVPDEEFGQRLRAFVVRAPGAEVSADDLKAFVKAGLARYKVPREIVFLDELPRNSTGKIVKRELRGAPDKT